MQTLLMPWKFIGAEPVLNAAPWLSIIRDRLRLPHGVTLDDYYRVVLPESSAYWSPGFRKRLSRAKSHYCRRASVIAMALASRRPSQHIPSSPDQ